MQRPAERCDNATTEYYEACGPTDKESAQAELTGHEPSNFNDAARHFLFLVTDLIGGAWECTALNSK